MSFMSILNSIFLRPLQLLFEVIYMLANRIIDNPGFSIIVLSMVMNFLVLPLYKRADAMQEEERDMEARLHKGVSHIKRTFRGDEKMMILQTYYRQNNYKPTYVLRGAISLLLQIPFFIAAYRFLSGLELLRGVAFGPIADLGAPDKLLHIGGYYINALPIIMTAVNLISCIVFTKGSTLKSKIQLYSMAIFFLFFLYASPSGLVFYWTLNNVFSLVKTIFYKLKNPGKVLSYLLSIAGLMLIIVAAFVYKNPSLLKKVFIISCGILLQLPLIYSLIKSRFDFSFVKETYKSSSKIFFTGGAFLSVLIGFTIPSSVIKSSPQEFVNVNYFQNPVWYIIATFCIAFGAFVVWFGIFYWLAKPEAKALFDKCIWMLCGVAIVNYMFFGKNLGTLTSVLSFQKDIAFSVKETFINVGVIIALICVLYLIYKLFNKHVFEILLIAVIALSVMAPIDIIKINSQVKNIEQMSQNNQATPQFKMTKDGKNVIVLMLDRAMGEYLPYIFNEKPELKEKFSGFTAYTNVISFGGFTNFGTPPLLGGYEYTPVEMNKRAEEPLVSKHNEALKVMPVLFSQNKFDVTVFDPVYANYQWIPDLSVFDEYPEISAYITMGKYLSREAYEQLYNHNMRNFFCYSILKAAPVALQRFLYDYGNYYRSDVSTASQTTIQTTYGLSKASGTYAEFMEAYNVLDNLPNITRIEDSNTDSFLLMTNDLTHEPMMLQLPSYLPAQEVDNTAFEKEYADGFTLNGKTLRMDEEIQIIHYQTNMATLIQLGEWFDYMRANDVYDNTRIILVSDHGRPLNHDSSRILPDGTDTEFFYPLLMVKDFEKTGFTFSDEFMTNADVPTLATENIIEKPVNPFTGKVIESTEKNKNAQYIISSGKWDVGENSGNMFLPGDWYRVSNKNMQDIKNWKEAGRNTTFPIME